jgi:large subunit ribosomal protein L10
MPSAKVLESKKARVDEITEQLKGAAAGVIVDYKGISVADDTKLRKELREAGVKYYVEKNSMLRFALHNAGLEGLDYVLEGTTAIALSDDDQTAPARILGKYIEGADDKSTFAMKAGFIGTEIYDAAGVTALSKIPSRDVLLAQLVGSLQGPMQKLAATIQAVADKKSEEGAA